MDELCPTPECSRGRGLEKVAYVVMPFELVLQYAKVKLPPIQSLQWYSKVDSCNEYKSTTMLYLEQTHLEEFGIDSFLSQFSKVHHFNLHLTSPYTWWHLPAGQNMKLQSLYV